MIRVEVKSLPPTLPRSPESLSSMNTKMYAIALFDVRLRVKMYLPHYSGLELRRRVVLDLAKDRCNAARNGNVVLQVYYELAYVVIARKLNRACHLSYGCAAVQQC